MRPDIKYTSRDYASIRRELLTYAERYYPETFRDFNEASFGSLMIDSVSYIGDILSFYLDYQVNESLLDWVVSWDTSLFEHILPLANYLVMSSSQPWLRVWAQIPLIFRH